MKKQLIIIGIGTLLGINSLRADDVTATGFHFRRVKEQVVLHFNIEAPANAVRSDYRMILTPQLYTESDTLTLKSFVLYGNRNMKRERQRALLDGRAWDNRWVLTNNDQLSYTDTLQYQSWMSSDACALRLLVQEEGCCSVDDLSPLSLAGLILQEEFKPLLTDVAPVSSSVTQAQTKYIFLRRLGTDSIASRGVSVRFPVDRIELDPDFSSNKQNLQQIIEAVNLVRNDPRTQVEQISITGYASPEGSVKRNQYLSEKRALALKEYIQQMLNISDEQFKLTAGGEDWQGLKQLVEESDMRYKQEVLDIINQVPEAQRKARLRALAGGRPYQSMLDVLYPQLRDACYINVWYSEKPDEVAVAINEAISDITAECYERALQRLESVKHDARAWNAIATALILQGKTDEAIPWLQKASEAGDENAKENLKRINNN